MFETFVIPALAFHLAIIQPAFQDLVPTTGQFQGILSEFTLMDNVATKKPIITIKRNRNILQRRDASCDLNYKKLMGATTRIIATEELYSAVRNCANEFYQDSLKDWRSGDPLFGNKILPYFQEATMTDIASNSYFGDIDRIETGAMTFSTTKFDGIFKWLYKFAAAGVIPASQTLTMPVVNMEDNPATAYSIVVGLFNKQPLLLRNMPAAEKAYYVSRPIDAGYKLYLRGLGEETANIIEMYANGVKVTSYEGIRIYVDPLWEPILQELYGDNHNAAVLTLRGNFIFATDKTYGEGENLDEALMVWYEKKELTWYFQQFMKAGTGIALPEFCVFSLPA